MKNLITLILLLTSLSVIAQEKRLISAIGLSHQNDNYKYTISIGEPIIGEICNDNVLLNQGFIPINTSSVPTDIEENNITLEIYPNPCFNQLNIKGLDLSKGYTIELIGTNGDIVLNNTLKSDQINTSSLSAGAYLLIISNKKERFKKTIVKQ